MFPGGELNTWGDAFIGVEFDLHFGVGGYIKIGWDIGNFAGDD